MEISTDISIDIEVIGLLNEFSWRSLNCFYKPYSIVVENVVKNASYYYLLLKDYVSDFDTFLLEETGVSYHSHCKRKGEFYETLERIIKENVCTILITNQYYNQEDGMYKKKHHGHPVILKGYSEVSDTYRIMDENYATSKLGGAVEFHFVDVNKLELIERSCDISRTNYEAFTMDTFEDYSEDAFAYVTFQKASHKPDYIEPYDVVKKYKEFLPIIIESLDQDRDDAKAMLHKLEEDPYLIRTIYISYLSGKKRGLQEENNMALLFKNHGGIVAKKYYYLCILDILLREGKIVGTQDDRMKLRLRELLDAYESFKTHFYTLVFFEGEHLDRKHFSSMYEVVDVMNEKGKTFFNELLVNEWNLTDV